jgi:nitroimidazol reductase NimA-like FMN-containing flavoprotein (pyridoxamine 5'-phosphate oxidase superfamily)
VHQPPNIQNLSTDECLRLLASQQLGRLAVVTDEGARIFPVNYAVDGDAIAIRSEPSAIVRFAPLHEVEFEVDHIDPEDGTGWAIVTDGTAQLITDALDTVSEHTRTLTPPNWSHRPKPEWLRITLTRIVGVRMIRDPAAGTNPGEPEPASPIGSDLGSRRLLDEVRTRLLALTQAHWTQEPDADSLRRGAHHLETIVRRLQWLADTTNEHPDSPPEPIRSGRRRHAEALATASPPMPSNRGRPTGADRVNQPAATR